MLQTGTLKALELGLTCALNCTETASLLAPCNAVVLCLASPCSLAPLLWLSALHDVDSERGCVTSTDSSRDFCPLSAESVDLQFIWCRKMPPHWLHFNNEHMVTWVSPPHLTVWTQVCVCLLSWAVHSFVHDGERTWPCACVGTATCHSRCCAEPRRHLQCCTIRWPSETSRRIPLARLSRMEHLPGRLRGFCLKVKLPVPWIFEPAVFAQWREELVGMTPVGERQMSVCHMRGEDGEWGESANEVEGADSWACK